MVFSSLEFIFLFLPLFLFCINLSKKYKKFFIIFFSVLFMYIAERNFILVVSIIALFNFYLAHYLYNKKILFFGIFFNLSLLIYYKYLIFFNSIFNLTDKLLVVALPAGISFITFHSISYLVDVYSKKIDYEKKFFDFYLFIFMFPQVIAGPITRYSNVYKKIKILSNRYTLLGIYYFLIGLFQKIIIADSLGQYVDDVYNLPTNLLSSIDSILGPSIYILQLYFDFSGYSHMAIGLGFIIGVKLPKNFNFPLESNSINEFWRKWHISLSSFIKDYLFIPLIKFFKVTQGTRNFNYFLCILICFLLSGLWHGASFTFIVWGFIHAFFAIIEKIFNINKKNIITKIYFLFLLVISFVFFRSESISQAISIINNLFIFTDINNYLIIKYLNYKFLFILLLAFFLSNRFAISILRQKLRNLRFKLIFKFSIFIIIFFMLGELLVKTYNPFIYFRF